MPTAWQSIPTSEVAVDADVDARTFVKLADRDSYLKELAEGTHTDKIPAQALETGSVSTGLKVTHFNNTTASGTVAISTNGTTYVDTGLASSTARMPILRFNPPSGGTPEYVADVVLRGASTNYFIRIIRTNDNVTAQNVAWSLRALGES